MKIKTKDKQKQKWIVLNGFDELPDFDEQEIEIMVMQDAKERDPRTYAIIGAAMEVH